jgi:hypothetical protein
MLSRDPSGRDGRIMGDVELVLFRPPTSLGVCFAARLGPISAAVRFRDRPQAGVRLSQSARSLSSSRQRDARYCTGDGSIAPAVGVGTIAPR